MNLHLEETWANESEENKTQKKANESEENKTQKIDFV